MKFFQSKIFFFTVLVQILGPFIFSFGNWDNIIQYVSAFGMAYAFWNYTVHHKQEIQRLHEKIDSIHEHIKKAK